MADIFKAPRSRPDRRTRVALRLCDWPEDDHRRWEEAFAVGSWYDETGAGARLRSATRTAWENAYGMWLGFLQPNHAPCLNEPLETRLSRERVKAYCESLARTNSALTTASQLDQLRLALRLLSPRTDWRWLALITKRVKAKALCRPKGPRQQEIGKLSALGFKLMDKVLEQGASKGSISLATALTYRDGLIIALEAATLLRRSNLAMMIIGQHLLRTGGDWQLSFGEHETKNHRPLHIPLPTELAPYIETYLSTFRPVFPDAHQHQALWASAKGGALRAGAIYDLICARTEAGLGRATNPHLFRDAAATSLSIHAPDEALAAADLLGHTSFSHTQHHYIRAQGVTGARLLAQALRKGRR